MTTASTLRLRLPRRQHVLGIVDEPGTDRMYCSERGSPCSRQAVLFAQLSLRDIPHAWSLAHTMRRHHPQFLNTRLVTNVER